MAKKRAMTVCGSPAWLSWLVLIVGVLLALQELQFFNTGLTGWSLLFILVGIGGLAKSSR